MCRLVRIILAAVVLLCAGCDSKRKADFDSADPGDKLYAIRASTSEADGSAPTRRTMEHLVEQLGSDDPAVRMMSIIALEKITGERKGYDPYAERQRRHASIDAWAHSIESGSLDGVGGSIAESPMTQGRSDGSE